MAGNALDGLEERRRGERRAARQRSGISGQSPDPILPVNNSPEQTGREAAPAENGATISEREARIRDYLKTTQDDPFYTGDLTYLLVILDAERLMIQHLKSALREIEPQRPAPLPAAHGSANIIVVIAYNPDAPDGHEIRVALTDLCKGMLSTLTDFELKVFATEVGLLVCKRIEMPSSPNK